MGIFNANGSLAGPTHASGGGSIDWTKQQSYNAWTPDTASAHPAQGSISFGTLAHSFLDGLAHTAAHAVTHPIDTAKDVGKGLVDSAVNAGKTSASLLSNATKGVYHLGAAGIDAATGNKDAALKHIQQLNQDYQKSYINQQYGSKYAGDTSGLGNAAGFALDAAGLKGGGSLIKEGIKGAAESGVKAVGKATLKGSGEGAAFGGAYGAANAAKQNDLSAGNIAKNVGEGAATGALAGGVLGGGSKSLGETITKWNSVRAETAGAHHVAGEGQPTEVGGVTSVDTQTHVSPDTARQIATLNHATHELHVNGPHVDGVQAVIHSQEIRNAAAHAMDGIANDRAVEAKIAPEEAHKQLATGTDTASKHYQAAADIAQTAHAEYATQAKRIAHDLPADFLSTDKNNSKTTTSSHVIDENAPVGKDSDVAGKTGSKVEKLYDRVAGQRGSGMINPSRAASRAGNVGLARAGADLVANKRVRTYQAKQVASEFSGLMKGLNHDEVNAAIEGATPASKEVAAAAAFFKAHANQIGGEAVEAGSLKGTRENYLPHVATGMERQRGRGATNGLKKNTRYNIERQSIEHVDEHGNITKEDKYKTVDEFDKAIKELGGKGAERNTVKLLEHLLTTEGHSIENARTVEKLADTRMTDGRPALSSLSDKNMSNPKFKDYTIIDNRLIHPDATNVYEAITRSGKINNPFGAALVRVNSLSKRGVTLNGFFHAVNIWKSSYATQGLGKSLWAVVAPTMKSKDVERAIGYGLKLARASSDNLFDEVGKQTGLTGKIEHVMKPLDELLFHKFGDRQGLMTFQTIEKKLIKRGLTPDEAGRIAADQGNQVMHFVTEDQMSTASRQASQLFLFAGQFLQNTAKTATNVFGVGLDRTLSKEGQHAAQRLAVERVARMFAYSFAAAQAINLAATGKYTWQNGNGFPLDPVWYKDPKTGKQYRITNNYGQLKDILGFMTNPVHEFKNKLAPGANELIQQISGVDSFTSKEFVNHGDSQGQQILDRMFHAATGLFTPAGINLKNYTGPADQRVKPQPGPVMIARQFGINSSSAKASDAKLDFTKIANDKKAAQSLIDAYGKGDQSKLAAMQALKAAGNGHFDKFFSEHPELDPTSKSFSGWAQNNKKEVSANIKAGFDVAKSNGTSLAYMQSVQESGSSYFDKFFKANPNLDPTSDQYDGSGSKQAARAKAEAKYAAKSIKYTNSKYLKSPGRRSVKTTVGKTSLTKTKVPRTKSVKVPKLKVKKLGGQNLIKKTKKVGF